MDSFILYNGVDIPVIGFGTGIAKGILKHPKYFCKRFIKECILTFVGKMDKNNPYTLKKDLKKDLSLKRIVKIAATNGCKLFDTASSYSYSEEYLGNSLKKIDKTISRNNLFIITKASNVSQREKRIKEEFDKSLKKLKSEYIDLYLLHWPQTGTYLTSWKEMEELYETGKVRAIGVSNFNISHLEELLKVAKVKPMVNEIECHPLLQQHELRDYCKKNGIQIIAHTPTGKLRKEIVDSEIIKELVSKYKTTSSKLILRWHYQLGDISIPNTTNPNHLKENLFVPNFVISDEDMKKIKQLDSNIRIWPNPDTADFYKL